MEDTAQFTSSDIRQRPVLIGRARERVFLQEELDRAFAGEGRLVLLGGEAGIGKTTLARDVAREAHRHGATVLTGHCHDLTATPPYEPWLDLMIGLGGEEGFPPLPEAFASGRLEGVESPVALFTQTLAFLSSLAQRAPVLLLFEDLHWSDSPSLELLRLVAGRISALPVLILVTYRVDELTRRHPLYQQLPGLVRAGGGMRIDIKRLDHAEISSLVRASYALEPEAEARLTDYLEQHAEGNPFFAIELMRALEEEGLLTGSAQGARLVAVDRVVLPPLLTQVIDLRVNRLGETARDLLSIASVIGQEVSLALWAEVASVRDDELLTLVETAIDARLLESNRDGMRARFAHALTRESLYESAFPPRRRQWHQQVAEALMRLPSPDPDAVAHHLVQAGDDRASTWLVLAGNRAQRVYAWLVAAERFIAAATALEDLPGKERERGWLLFRAARLMRLADPNRGLTLLYQAQRLAFAAGDKLLAGDAHYSIGLLLAYAEQFDGGLAEMSAGIDFLEKLDPTDLLGDSAVAIALADSLPEHEASADKDLATSVELYEAIGMHHRRGGHPWFLATGGRYTEATRIANHFLSAAEKIENPGGVVQSAAGHAYQGLGICCAAAGRPREATSAFESSRNIYRTLDHYGVIVLCYLAELRYVALTYRADDPAYRHRLCDEAVAAFGHASGALPPGTPPGIVRLATLVLDGEWDEAAQILGDTPPGGNSFCRREVREATMSIALNRGDSAKVLELISEFMPDGPRQTPGSRLYPEALLCHRIAASLALQQRDFDEARIWLEAHDTWLTWSGSMFGQADGKLAWSQYHRAAGDIDAAVACAADAVALAEAPRQPLLLLEAHRELGELATSARRFDRAGHHLQEALRLAELCQARHLTTTVLMALAELRAAEGQSDAARSLADEAVTLGATSAGASLAERRRNLVPTQATLTVSSPFGLTSREVEVLKLVAEGLTDSAVADRLFISPRTVSQHLRSIYGKLDVSSRTSATRLAIEHGLI
jgi:DNA-binding CsgD family transcriptional regulator/tetratricopeptide (TPR) repeat protein